MTKSPILIVDDDASQRRLIEFWLQEDGHSTVTASDGSSALRAFAQYVPTLIVSDVRMPGMTGIDLLSRIKADSPDMPFILITAFAAVDDAVEAMKLGAADYILKPLKPDELKISVRRALERQKLLDENRQLRELASANLRFENIIAQSRKMRSVLDIAAQVARRDSTVLLGGESGTGKELLAKAIHQSSLRADRPFVSVNCGALPETLAESELFGHRKGSFTGAVADRAGKFEAANEGTIFLDEIGELSLPLQVKLLRVLQEREVDKIGEPHPMKVNVRIIAASNRNLKNLVEDGQFRDDLYYRLSVVTIDLPPLRERREDISLLAQHFLNHFATRYEIPGLSISDEAMEKMLQYDWPGNVRELQNVIERLAVLAKNDVVTAADLPPEIVHAGSRVASVNFTLPDDGIDLEAIEKEILQLALEKNHWNQTQTAKYLNISRKTLIYRMEKFTLAPPEQSN